LTLALKEKMIVFFLNIRSKFEESQISKLKEIRDSETSFQKFVLFYLNLGMTEQMLDFWERRFIEDGLCLDSNIGKALCSQIGAFYDETFPLETITAIRAKLIRSYFRDNQPDAGLQLFNSTKSKSPLLCEVIIRCLWEINKLVAIVRIIKDMTTQSIRLTSDTVTIGAKAYTTLKGDSNILRFLKLLMPFTDAQNIVTQLFSLLNHFDIRESADGVLQVYQMLKGYELNTSQKEEIFVVLERHFLYEAMLDLLALGPEPTNVLSEVLREEEEQHHQWIELFLASCDDYKSVKLE